MKRFIQRSDAWSGCLQLAFSNFPVNSSIKLLLWHVHVHFDCAGSHKTLGLSSGGRRAIFQRILAQKCLLWDVHVQFDCTGWENQQIQQKFGFYQQTWIKWVYPCGNQTWLAGTSPNKTQGSILWGSGESPFWSFWDLWEMHGNTVKFYIIWRNQHPLTNQFFEAT